MLETLATALQESALSQGLRASVWLYPLVNTGHVLGIALLFGAIVPLDLRLLGGWRRVPVDALATVLVPVAVSGLLLALATGLLLFASRPLDYVVEPLFGWKMGLLAVAVLNALWLRRSPRWRLLGPEADVPVRPAWRLAALGSLLLWLAVIAAGRLIGYR
jgi:hypothetical protein